MIDKFIIDCLKKSPKSIFQTTKEQKTYLEVSEYISEISQRLKESFPRKSKCGILISNPIDMAYAILAAFVANMVVVPMSMSYGMTHCENIIKESQINFLMTDSEVPYVISHNMPLLGVDGSVKNDEKSNWVSEEVISDVALIMYTSGTTGKPKGAMITEDSLVRNIRAIDEYFLLNRKDCIYISRPLYHSAVMTGEFLVGLYSGCDLFFSSVGFNPHRMLNEIKKYNVDVLGGTPTLFNQLALVANDKFCFCLKKIVISGECLCSKIVKRINKIFANVEVYHVYGMTECAPRVSYLPPKDFKHKPLSVGIPLKDVEVKIFHQDENGIGILLVKSPCLMKGYYNDIERTEQVVSKGWLNTGDLAKIDEEGYIYIFGRADEMIIRAGMNIYPQEIESMVSKLECINDVLVFRIITNETQEIGMQVILEENFKEMSKRELYEQLVTVLEPYQMPIDISIVKEIKKSGAGKKMRLYKNVVDQ